MKKISHFNVTSESIIRNALTGCPDEPFVIAVSSFLPTFAMLDLEYSQRCQSHEIYQTSRSHSYNTIELKPKMGELYENSMVSRTGPVRDVYDRIFNLSPNNTCPYCGIGGVAELDHFLTKSSYPVYALSAFNLVPSCRDCNKHKGKRVFRSQDTQIFHPYFDTLPEGDWLIANLSENPFSVTFVAIAPANWSYGYSQKLQFHFSTFKLSKLYGLQATNELSEVRSTLIRLFRQAGPDRLSEYLLQIGDSRENRNSWQSVLYRSLGASHWFCSGGVESIPGPQL